jgi:hypothetical protein
MTTTMRSPATSEAAVERGVGKDFMRGSLRGLLVATEL